MAKKFMRKLFILVFCLSSVLVFAQVPPDDPGGGEDPGDPVPISGIGMLLAAGAAYGAKKAYDVYRKKGNQ